MRNVGFSWNGWLFPAECFLVGHFWRTPRDQGIDLVRPEGFEPPTLGLEVRCSIQLSYGRKLLFRSRQIIEVGAGAGAERGSPV
ncbi:MAG: hypothetical protein QOH48_2450, partial [Actinomycetota bacterium]|nr:hypothetical protein [Actinomycetota bacterium]